MGVLQSLKDDVDPESDPLAQACDMNNKQRKMLEQHV
jgi:hypothetical protein